MSHCSVIYQQNVFKCCYSGKHFSVLFTYKMAPKINCHKYGTELCHCHPMYSEAISSNSTRKLLWFEITKMLIAVLKINVLCHLL